MEESWKSESKTFADSGLYQLVGVLCWNWVLKFALLDSCERQRAFLRAWRTESSEFGVGNHSHDSVENIQAKISMLDERQYSKVREKTFVKLKTHSIPILTARNETGQVDEVKRNFVYLKLGKEHDVLDKNNLKNDESLWFFIMKSLYSICIKYNFVFMRKIIILGRD